MPDEQKPKIITDPLQPDTGRQAQIGTDIPFQGQPTEPPKKDEPKEPPKKEEPKKEPPPQNDHFDVDTGGAAKVPIQQP